MKKKISIKSFTLVWMPNLKLKSWSDSNWCSQHKVMLGKVIFYSRTLWRWIFWSEQNCSLLPDWSLFNIRFWSMEKGSLSKRSCLSHCSLITIANFDYKIKYSRFLSKKKGISKISQKKIIWNYIIFFFHILYEKHDTNCRNVEHIKMTKYIYKTWRKIQEETVQINHQTVAMKSYRFCKLGIVFYENFMNT